MKLGLPTGHAYREQTLLFKSGHSLVDEARAHLSAGLAILIWAMHINLAREIGAHIRLIMHPNRVAD